MKIKGLSLFWVFIWSIFMGVTAISIGFGAVFPSMNRIAKPFICPRGEMELETQTYRPYPGQTITTLTWYCTDQETGNRTELGIFPMSLYAGVIYGLLLFVVIVFGWYLYQIWNAAPKSAESQKWAGWIQNGLIFVFVIGLILISLRPLFSSFATPPAPTAIVDATATSIALTFESMSSGAPSDFNSTEKPLADWNNIPIMPQATAGHQADIEHYSFRVPVDSGTIASFYSDALKSQGWNIQDQKLWGLEFTKENSTLLVTMAPYSDLQSWVVTLVLIP